MKVKDLLPLIEVQSKSYATEDMTEYILGELAKIEGLEVLVDDQTIYVAKGEADIFPCMVAHTDTVHKKVGKAKAYHHDGFIFAMNVTKDKFVNFQQIGTGGDDKVGIFITLEMLRTQPFMKAAFFPDEEVGCRGSGKANMDFFNDTGFILQCDRKGSTDFTKSICGLSTASDEWLEEIDDLISARELVDGGLTDVYTLKSNGYPNCVANMSCGYYYPHTDREVIAWDVLVDTYELCTEIFERCKHQAWPHTPARKVQRRISYMSQQRGFNWGNWGEWDDYDPICPTCAATREWSYKDQAYKCNHCKS